MLEITIKSTNSNVSKWSFVQHVQLNIVSEANQTCNNALCVVGKLSQTVNDWRTKQHLTTTPVITAAIIQSPQLSHHQQPTNQSTNQCNQSSNQSTNQCNQPINGCLEWSKASDHERPVITAAQTHSRPHSYQSPYCINPHFISTEYTVIGCSHGELSRFTVH